MKIWWITHENLVNFPWTNSQDFNGFLFSSMGRRLIRELTVEQSMNREKSWNTVVIRELYIHCDAWSQKQPGHSCISCWKPPIKTDFKSKYQMCEKLVVSLIVTGECEAETMCIVDSNLYFPYSYSPRHIMLIFPLSYSPADIPLIVFNCPSKTTQVRILNFDLMNLPNFPCR